VPAQVVILRLAQLPLRIRPAKFLSIAAREIVQFACPQTEGFEAVQQLKPE